MAYIILRYTYTYGIRHRFAMSVTSPKSVAGREDTELLKVRSLGKKIRVHCHNGGMPPGTAGDSCACDTSSYQQLCALQRNEHCSLPPPPHAVCITQGHHHSGPDGVRSSVSCRAGLDAPTRKVWAYPPTNADIELKNGGFIDSYPDYIKCGAEGRAKRGGAVDGNVGGDCGDAVGDIDGAVESGHGGIEYAGAKNGRGGRRGKTGGGVAPYEWGSREKERYADSYAETAAATETPTRGYEVATSDVRTSLAKESFASTTDTRRKGEFGGRGEVGVASDWRRTAVQAVHRDAGRGWYA